MTGRTPGTHSGVGRRTRGHDCARPRLIMSSPPGVGGGVRRAPCARHSGDDMRGWRFWEAEVRRIPPIGWDRRRSPQIRGRMRVAMRNGLRSCRVRQRESPIGLGRRDGRSGERVGTAAKGSSGVAVPPANENARPIRRAGGATHCVDDPYKEQRGHPRRGPTIIGTESRLKPRSAQPHLLSPVDRAAVATRLGRWNPTTRTNTFPRS